MCKKCKWPIFKRLRKNTYTLTLLQIFGAKFKLIRRKEKVIFKVENHFCLH